MKDKNIGMKQLLKNIGLIILLPMIIFLFFAIFSHGLYATPHTMLSILKNSIQPIILAWGLSFIIAADMWDLSGGSAINLGAMAGASIAKMLGVGTFGLLLLIITITMLCTFFTGFIYNIIKIRLMVISIGMCLIYETLTLLLFPQGMRITGTLTYLARAPYCYIILAVFFVAMVIIYDYTKFGYNVRAVGSGQVVAKEIGVNIVRTKFKIFLVQGLFFGVAATIMISNSGQIKPVLYLGTTGIVFDAIMAISIGSVLERYCNRSIAVMIGAVCIKMISSGLLAIGLSSTLQGVTTGVFLLIIVGFANNQPRIIQHAADKAKADRANRAYQKAAM